MTEFYYFKNTILMASNEMDDEIAPSLRTASDTDGSLVSN